MGVLANIGHALLHLLVVLIGIVLLVVGVVFVVRWTLQQHDTTVTQGVTIKAQQSATAADVAADNDADAQPPAVAARAVRAQRTIDQKAQDGAQNKPVDYHADDLRSVWGQPAHAQP